MADSLVQTFNYVSETTALPKLGNGRFVRNVFEMSIKNQARRLKHLPHVSEQDMRTIKADDLPEARDLVQGIANQLEADLRE